MPFVTIQLGQCGNQLGATWFDILAEELLTGGYGQHAADTYFQQLPDNPGGTASSKQWSARAVMVDMEPKVIYSAKQKATSSPHGWRYAAASAASGQSGSGNNWALGHNKYGPMMAPCVLDLVRKQVEACDVFEGFLMLQSMAGGTGAGAGTFLSEALIDDYSNAHMLNCCVWPYSSGEVTVQPYNTLLSLAALSEVSSGILLMQNEVLHETCTRLLGQKHPGFKELNTLAARGLASVLLPCRARTVAPLAALPASSASRNSRQPPTLRPTSAGRGSSNQNLPSNERQSKQPVGTLSCGASEGVVTGLGQLPQHPLGDLCCHLFNHPSYQLASLRSLPQLPSTSVDFTTFSWPTVLKRLKAMSLAGVYLDEGLSSYMPGTSSAALPLHKYKNRSVSSMLTLRGSEADTIAVSEFNDPNMFASWSVDPLLVTAHNAKFTGCQLAASLLSTDQAGVAPLHPMQCKAYAMLSARAYLHQYEACGLEKAEFERCFAVVEEIKAAYASLG